MFSSSFKSTIACSSLALLCVAIIVSGQYSGEDGRAISQAELAKLMRSSKLARSSLENQGDFNPSGNARLGGSRNLYNRQQPLQYSPSFNKRNYNDASNLGESGFGSGGSMGTPNSRSSANSDDDDGDDGGNSNFGPNFDSNEDGQANNDGDGPAMNLNQAASGFSSRGGNNDDSLGDANFNPSSNFDSSDFGPSDGFGSSSGGNGRLKQAGSHSAGLRNQFNGDEDAGIPAYNPGPNSAVNSDDNDDEPRGAAPNANQNNDEDDD